MNFVVICLHCLDMRDFHSSLRETPFLDELRLRSAFIPMGRAQGHHHGDSLVAELTGVWTARCCDSVLTDRGYVAPRRAWLPRTVIERLQEDGYDLITCMDYDPEHGLGTAAADGGMRNVWLKHELDRRRQFSLPHRMDRAGFIERIGQSNRFYAHIVLRDTHRPWGQPEALHDLVSAPRRGLKRWLPKARAPRDHEWPVDASWARRAALDQPDGFAALRRRGLAAADRYVREIFEAVADREDVTFVVYSNHGEVFDHFRFLFAYETADIAGHQMIEGTSHGNYPYEVAYANMQMWVLPGRPPVTMRGVGRLVDLAPTILEIAGVEADGMDGESMMPHFSTGTFPARERYAEGPLGGGCLSMVRRDGFKLVSTGSLEDREENIYALRGFREHRLAVFDLTSDPYEYVNLVDTPQGREVLEWAIARHRELKRPTTPGAACVVA